MRPGADCEPLVVEPQAWQTSNNGAITFPTPTAGWGTVTHFGIYDAASGGNLLFFGALTIAKTVNQADTVTFPAASLSITFA